MCKRKSWPFELLLYHEKNKGMISCSYLNLILVEENTLNHPFIFSSLHHSQRVRLFSQVSFRVQYPQDFQVLSYEDLKEFKHTRYGNFNDPLFLSSSCSKCIIPAYVRPYMFLERFKKNCAWWIRGHYQLLPASFF